MTLGDRLGQLFTGIIHDVLRDRDVRGRVLPASIRPVIQGSVAAGPVFTALGMQDDSVSAHDSLLSWARFLSSVPAGAIAILEANDNSIAHMGELSAFSLGEAGVVGFVTDGGSRDIRMIRDQGFPVWCSYVTPTDIAGRWVIDALDVPVRLGEVSIEPGDYAIADDDGVVVIPGAMAEVVIAEAEQLVSTEDSMREAIGSGKTALEAFLEHGKF